MFFITAVTAVGCGVDETVVALVGGQTIRMEEVQNFLEETTGMPWSTVSDRAAIGLFDQFLDQQVVVAAAGASRSESMPDEPTARVARLRRLIGEICGPAPMPSPEDVDLVVQERLQETEPARAKVRQLLVDSELEADRARDRLNAGEPFLNLSREVSKAPNAETGGDVGILARGTLPQSLDDVVFALSEGEISAPVESPAGYHIFQVLEVIPEGPRSRDEIETEVKRELTDELTREFTRRCVARTAQEVGVKVYGDHLWFEYRGRYREVTDEE